MTSTARFVHWRIAVEQREQTISKLMRLGASRGPAEMITDMGIPPEWLLPRKGEADHGDKIQEGAQAA